MAKSNFIVRGGADFSKIKQELDKTQKQIQSFQSNLSKSLKVVGATLGALISGKLIKDSTKMAMGVESAFDNIGRNMGESALAFNHWAKTQSKALGMARADAYQYGSTFSNLLSSFTSGTKETADQTQELMKAAAIIASKTGRTYDDTANRIRSGMLGSTEAIEDLGIYTNISMIESTEAFKKFAGSKSWSQLTFQTQQQIRLAAILEQTYKRYGDTLADTTQTRQAQFLASLKNVQLSLGQAFLPIYNAVLPALTAMADALGRVIGAFAQFTQALFGKSMQAQTKNTQAQAGAVTELGDATEKAGKQAKGALVGFDEINQLNQSSGSGAGTVGGITTDQSLTEVDNKTGGIMEDVSTKASEMAEKVRTAFGNMKTAIVENKNLIVPAIGAITGALAGLAIVSTVGALAGKFKALGVAIKGAWAILAANPILLVAAAIGALIGALIAAYHKNEQFRKTVDDLWARIKAALTPVVQKLGEVLQWLWQSVVLPLAAIIKDVLVIAFDLLTYVAKWLWQYVLVPLGDFIINSLIPAYAAVANVILSALKVAIEALIKVFQFLWNSVLKPIVLWLGNTFKPVFEEVGKAVQTIIKGMQTTFEGLIKFITGVFTANWKLAWEGVRDIFKGIFDSLYGIVKVPLNLIIDAINKVIDGLNSISIDIPDWVPVFGGQTWGINIPKIPRLAEGGITNGPTLALIGDNPGGREVVSPLDDLTDIIASAVGSAVLNAMQMGQGAQTQPAGDIVFKIDGNTFARIINPYLSREQSRIGGMIIKTV